MRTWIKVMAVIVLVFVLLSCLGLDGLVLVPLSVLFGWVAFLWRVLPRITINVGGLVMAVVALAVSAMLAHSIGSWLWNPTHPEKPWRFKWTVMFLVMVVMMFAAGISVVAITHQTIWLARNPGPWFDYGAPRERANRVRCASNLRQIGQGIGLYASENAGRFPDALLVLVPSADLTPDVFVCPSSNAEPAIGANVQEILEQLAKPEHMSYVYIGKGMTTSTPGDTIVTYEPLQNHDGDGGNVLFADGHVDWFNGKQLKEIITNVQARSSAQTVRSTTRPAK